jgi:hypothetical protein
LCSAWLLKKENEKPTCKHWWSKFDWSKWMTAGFSHAYRHWGWPPMTHVDDNGPRTLANVVKSLLSLFTSHLCPQCVSVICLSRSGKTQNDLQHLRAKNKNHQGKTPKPMSSGGWQRSRCQVSSVSGHELQSVPQRVLMEIPKEKQWSLQLMFGTNEFRGTLLWWSAKRAARDWKVKQLEYGRTLFRPLIVQKSQYKKPKVELTQCCNLNWFTDATDKLNCSTDKPNLVFYQATFVADVEWAVDQFKM